MSHEEKQLSISKLNTILISIVGFVVTCGAAMSGWALVQLVDIKTKLAAEEVTYMSQQSEISGLESRVNDHENRIRTVEINQGRRGP